MLDLLLAMGHHVLIFGIFGIICAEFWAVRPWLEQRDDRAHCLDRPVVWILATAIRLLSLPLTLSFMRWRKLALQPSEGDIHRIRRYLHLELALFMLLPIVAAAMARGYGEF
jgi:putative membrane protein